LITTLKNIISKTAANRDSWDASNDGKLWKTLKCKVEAAKDRRDAQNCNEIIAGQVSSPEPAQLDTHAMDKIKLKALEDYRNREHVLKLEKAQDTLPNQQNKLKTMRTLKVRAHDSIETKMFSVLKELGVELSSYHGGSLNGKDIKKVMNNACHIFNIFLTIFKEGKRPTCVLLDANIDASCLQFREVFVLWDGAFLLARTINPVEAHMKIYCLYVDAAMQGSKDLQCTVTPKVHLMLERVEW
jgi:hypothetical protein